MRSSGVSGTQSGKRVTIKPKIVLIEFLIGESLIWVLLKGGNLHPTITLEILTKF